MKGIEQVVEKEKVGVSTKSSISASYDDCSAQASSVLFSYENLAVRIYSWQKDNLP